MDRVQFECNDIETDNTEFDKPGVLRWQFFYVADPHADTNAYAIVHPDADANRVADANGNANANPNSGCKSPLR